MCEEKLSLRNSIVADFLSCINGHHSELSNNAEYITIINACLRSIFLYRFNIKYHTDIPRFEMEGYYPVFKTRAGHFREFVDLIDYYINIFGKKEDYVRVQ